MKDAADSGRPEGELASLWIATAGTTAYPALRWDLLVDVAVIGAGVAGLTAALALKRAGRPPESIGYVNFHGTSTQLNDAVEARCVRRVFGRSAARLTGSSIKSMIGHPQGASGAAGVVATALAFSRGTLPPTINLQHQDPECDLDVIPNVARRADVEAALCNCLGFGSKNSALVLGRI